MLNHNISEINLPQNGCGLDKLEWTRVLNKNLRFFANTHVRVNIFLQKFRGNSNVGNALLLGEYSNDNETRKNVFYLATARKLAREGKLQASPKSDHNNRNNELRAFNPERRFQKLPPIENWH